MKQLLKSSWYLLTHLPALVKGVFFYIRLQRKFRKMERTLASGKAFVDPRTIGPR